MKSHYDFSKAERGKFYRKGASLRLPIYLDGQLQKRLERIAQKKGPGSRRGCARSVDQGCGVARGTDLTDWSTANDNLRGAASQAKQRDQLIFTHG